MNNPNGFYCFDKKEFSESFFNGMLQMLSSERNKREKEWERESLYVERYIDLCILEGAQRKIINKKSKVKCFLQGKIYRNVLWN